MNEFLTLQEAANYLKVEYKTLYRLVRSGELPAGKIGGVYRIRKSDIDHFFEQQKETLRRSSNAAPSPATCSACQTKIYSHTASPGQCRVCGEPLCANCWTIEGKRWCRAHAARDLSPNATASEEKTPMNQYPTPEGATRSRAPEAKPVPANNRVVTTAAAKWAEDAFISRFDTQVRQHDTVRNPVTGEEFKIRNWNDHHTRASDQATLPLLLPAQVLKTKSLDQFPLNQRSRYEMPRSRYTVASKSQSRLAIEAYCFSHVESYFVDGYDTQPVIMSQLFPVVSHFAKEMERQNAIGILGLASVTGWEEGAVEHVRSGHQGRGYRSPFVSLALVDLRSPALVYDPSDERLAPFLPLFALASEEERIQQVIEYVKQSLLTRHSVALTQGVEDLGLTARTVEKAFRKLGQKKSYVLDELKDIGLVISEKI